MRRLVAALGISLVAFAWTLPESGAHPSGVAYCTGWNADDKLGNEYIWTATSNCDTANHAADLLTVAAWLQRAQFSTVNPVDWHTINPLLPIGASAGAGWNVSVNGSVYVMPYFGINCRRIRSLHVAVHGNLLMWLRESGGECY